MSPNEVSLCMIVKDEVNTLGRLLDSVCQVLEQVVIVDTGSTDGTLNLINSFQEKYPNLELHHKEWTDNFSEARNFSFSLATKPWVGWLDADDVIDIEELRKFKETALSSDNIDCWILDYDYAQLPSGETALTLSRERFIRRDMNPTWIGAIHETIDIGNMRTRHYPHFTIHHDRSNKVIDPNRNVKILEKEYNKENPSPRTVYYYGKELFDRINPKGIEVLEEFTKMDSYYWDDMVNACARLGRHYLSTSDTDKAIDIAFRMYKEDGSRQRAEGYWILGRAEQINRNYEAAIEWYKRCLICNPGPPRVLDKEYYTWNPLVRLCECYITLNKLDEALKYLPKIKKHIGSKGEDYLRLVNLIRKELNPVGGLLTLERGDKVRRDSYDMEFHQVIKDEELDGLVTTDIGDCLLSDKLKPRGFFWLKGNDQTTQLLGSDLQFLVKSVYNQEPVSCFIKIDKSKDSYSFPEGIDDNFGPHRIRIKNAKLSAIKAGVPVVSFLESDFHYSPNISKIAGSQNNVLDICEELPSYKFAGLENADYITVSSDLLKDHVASITSKPIIVVEDHFEMTEREWL